MIDELLGELRELAAPQLGGLGDGMEALELARSVLSHYLARVEEVLHDTGTAQAFQDHRARRDPLRGREYSERGEHPDS